MANADDETNVDASDVLGVLNRAITAQKASAGKRRVVQPPPLSATGLGGSPFAGVKGSGSAVTSGGDYESHNFFTKVIDDAWTDDFSQVPVVGPGAAAAAKTYTQAQHLINQVGSYSQSALPGGIETFDWDKAGDISYGQAAIANAAALGRSVAMSVSGGQFKGHAARVSPLVSPDFDVTNPMMRKAAFEDDGLGRLASGTTDALFNWFLDPLVVGGKALKIARYGSEALQLPGMLSASTNIPKVIEHIGFSADDSILFRESAGTAGSVNQITEAGDHIARSDFNTLIEYAAFKSSPYRDLLAGVGAEITDPRLADMFVAAASGSEKHLAQLRTEAQSVSDALVNFGGSIDYERRILSNLTGLNDPALLDDVLEANYSAGTILEDLASRDKALYDAITLLDKEGTGLITQTGSFSAKAENLRNAWSAGKAQRDLPAAERSLSKTPQRPAVKAAALEQAGRLVGASGDDVIASIKATAVRSNSAIQERVFQTSSSFRKVRVWQWATGQRSAGFINTRTFDDGKSADELKAMLQDAKATRGDGQFAAWALSTWGAAKTDAQRFSAVEQIQRAQVAKIAESHGLPSELLLDQYEYLVERRTHVIATLRNPSKSRAFGVDPETGDLIVGTPQLVSQLETQVPLMDMRMMEQTARRLAKSPVYRGSLTDIEATFKRALGKSPTPANAVHDMGQSGSEVAIRWADELNSMWKAAVLLRLGYTQRNVAEGWLRSWAYLGKIPAIAPIVAARGVKNVVYANRRAWLKIRSIDAAQANLAAQVNEQRILIRQIETDLAEQVDMPQEWAADLRATAEASKRRIDGLNDEIASWEEKRTGVRKQFIGDDAAFAGKIGDVYRAEASNARTVENFFDSRTDRDFLKRLSDRQYTLIQPGEQQYFSELVQSVKQFRADQMATQLIDGKSVDYVLNWAKSKDANSWAHELGLDSISERTAQVRKVAAEIGNYLPTARARKAAAGENLPTPAQLQAALSDLPQDELAAIHGRQVKSLLEAGSKGKFRKMTQALFTVLGSMPESVLVRQPFYNSVFTRERDLLTAKLTAQGGELTADAAEKISRQAHRRALQATNETLFTITRYSNPAAALRFVSPFFAAFENSIRTWGRMIYRDPSIAARASILWNLPASLGSVYDSQTGERLSGSPFSFIAPNPNAVMSLPAPLANIIGGANGGLGAVVPLQSMNVISPGESPWLPGFNAPMVAVPLGNVLAQRPDVQQWLKDHLGDTVYNQFIPLGNAQGGIGGLTGQALPAWSRKLISAVRKDDDENYVKVLAAITQDALVDDALGVTPFNEKQVRNRADQFFKFSTLANLTLPVSLMRVSKYQIQLDAWHNLSADDRLTYAEKISRFRAMYGDSYMALTMSTTKSKVPNLDPTLETWRTVTDNPDQVQYIAEAFGTDAVGVLAATAPDGAMSPGVYNYWLDQPAEGTDGNWKSKASPYEIQQNSQVAEMWASYNRARASRDAELAGLGVNPETGHPWTINSQAAKDAGIVETWNTYRDDMLAHYGDIWSVYGPQAYSSQLPKTLAVVNHLLTDKQFMAGDTGRSQVWQDLAHYMRVRAEGLDAIRNGADSSYVRSTWENWSAAFKATASIGFMDFYDTYLEQDNLDFSLAE